MNLDATAAHGSDAARVRGGGPPPQYIRANSVARALTVLGDRWALLVLGNALLGVRHFGEWRRRLGIAGNILTERLSRLVQHGCLIRSPVGRGSYQLTEKGRDLFPAALMEWRYEQRWGIVRRGQPARLYHTACGRPMQPRLVCMHCRDRVDSRDVAARSGPGAGFDRQKPAGRRPSAATAQSGHGIFGETIEILGDRWSRPVVAPIFLKLRRYDRVQKEWGITTNVLTNRRERVVANGVLQRRPYQRRPVRYEYLLTPKYLDFYPFILAMLQWGDRRLAGAKGPPLLLRHKTCGHALAVAAICGGCGEVLRPEAVIYDDVAGS